MSSETWCCFYLPGPGANPTGAGNGAFDTTDLLTIQQEFPWTAPPYFGTSNDDVVCIDSVLNPDVQWCAPKAEAWTPSTSLPCVYHHRDPVVPEPGMLGLVILTLIAIIIWRNVRQMNPWWTGWWKHMLTRPSNA